MKNLRLKTLLIERSLVTSRQLDEAVKLTRGAGITWVEHLLTTGVLDEDRLCDVVARTAYVERCDPKALLDVPRYVLDTLPADLCFEHRVVPVGLDDEGDLRVVMLDPCDDLALAETQFFANRPVKREASTATSIAWALHEHYGARSALWPRATMHYAQAA